MSGATKTKRALEWHSKKVDLTEREKLVKYFESNIWKDKDAGALYDRKYTHNPAGDAHIWLALGKGERMASSYVAMPFSMQVQGKEGIAMQAVDVFTAFRYRGLSIYETQDREAPEYFAEKGGVLSFFAFPNPAAVKGHTKAGWKTVGALQRWVKVLDAKYVISRYIKNEKLASFFSKLVNPIMKMLSSESSAAASAYSINVLNRCDERIDDLFKRVSGDFDTLVVRNANYLNWKYCDCLDKNKVILAVEKDNVIGGYVVLEQKEDMGAIVDIFGEKNDAVTDALICAAVNYFRQREVRAISFAVLEQNWYLTHLKNKGFQQREGDRFVMGTITDQSINEDQYFDPTNWHVTLGDCDIESVL